MITFFRSMPFLAATFLLAVVLGGCYGDKLEVNGGEVYYKEGASEADAQKLGDFLNEIGYFNGEEKSVQLQKEGNRFIFRAVIQEEYMDDPKIASAFEIIGAQISKLVFDGAPVDVHLTDEYLETKKTVPFNPSVALEEPATPDSTLTDGQDSVAASE